VLPNPSGLNAHYSAQALAEQFAALRAEVDQEAVRTEPQGLRRTSRPGPGR
jgi:hypothetical protein